MVLEIWCEHGAHYDERIQPDGSVIIGPMLYPCVQAPAVEAITAETTTIYCLEHMRDVLGLILGFRGLVVLRSLERAEPREEQ